jgi:hypothetical protein
MKDPAGVTNATTGIFSIFEQPKAITTAMNRTSHMTAFSSNGGIKFWHQCR